MPRTIKWTRFKDFAALASLFAGAYMVMLIV
jgi:hypothetical protein